MQDVDDLKMLQPYCDNNMQLLKKISKSIFLKMNEQLVQADYDDFYSVANMTLWLAYGNYSPDRGVRFESFLYDCLKKRFKTEIRNRHRDKRVINQFTVSIDTIDENECSIEDFIISDFDTFEEVMKENEGQFSEKIQQYISSLSSIQKKILDFLVKGYKTEEIRKILGISLKEYNDNVKVIKSFENIKKLF